MNQIDRMIGDGLFERVRQAIAPKETYYVDGTRLKGSTEDFTAEFRGEVDRLNKAVPAGARLIAWFCRTADGERIHGQITIDNGRKTPSVVWEPGETTSLDYQDSQTVRFPSSSEKLMAAADPVAMMRLLNHPDEIKTLGLLEALGYVPITPMNGRDQVSFRKLDLVSADA